MVKWIVALVLILALVFAAGLRIDFKVLAEKFQKKHDPNVETLLKLGIDPNRISFKGKPWWTFRSEDNLFRRTSKWNPVKQLSDEVWKTSQAMKKAWGPGPAEIAESLATEGAAQARRNQLRAEAGLREARDTRNAMQGSGGASAAARGAET
jgi:hypothetical protein